MKDDHIVVYYKRKKSGGFDELDYFVWEREFMDKLITHEYVNKNQKSGQLAENCIQRMMRVFRKSAQSDAICAFFTVGLTVQI
jgi:hypothetical protein